jgi:hypothetical protein
MQVVPLYSLITLKILFSMKFPENIPFLVLAGCETFFFYMAAIRTLHRSLCQTVLYYERLDTYFFSAKRWELALLSTQATGLIRRKIIVPLKFDFLPQHLRTTFHVTENRIK